MVRGRKRRKVGGDRNTSRRVTPFEDRRVSRMYRTNLNFLGAGNLVHLRRHAVETIIRQTLSDPLCVARSQRLRKKLQVQLFCASLFATLHRSNPLQLYNLFLTQPYHLLQYLHRMFPQYRRRSTHLHRLPIIPNRRTQQLDLSSSRMINLCNNSSFNSLRMRKSLLNVVDWCVRESSSFEVS